jgi:hypothetical protein
VAAIVVRPNQRVQPTPLRGRKIVAILKGRFGPRVVLIYQCGAADAQIVSLRYQSLPFQLSALAALARIISLKPCPFSGIITHDTPLEQGKNWTNADRVHAKH